jgi:hypothetical protein
MPKITRALSVKQPYAELIMQGKKKIEYRTVRTRIIGERVYIYASKKLEPLEHSDASKKAWKQVKTAPEDLPTGVLIGSVIIKKCSEEKNAEKNYEWKLIEPERLPKNKNPTMWGNPFGSSPFHKLGVCNPKS